MLKTAVQGGLPGAKIIHADNFEHAQGLPGANVVDVVICDQAVLPDGPRPELYDPHRQYFQTFYVLSEKVDEQSTATSTLVNATGNFSKSADGIHNLLRCMEQDQRRSVEGLGHVAELQRLAPATDRYRKFFYDSPIAFIELETTDCLKTMKRMRQAGADDLRSHLLEHPHLWVHLVHQIHVRNVNQQAMALLAATEQTQIAGAVGKVFCRQSLPVLGKELQALWDGEQSLQHEADLTRFDGIRVPVQFHFKNQFGERAQRSFTTLAMVDVAEHHRLIDELEASEQRFKSLSQASFEAIFFSRKGVCLDQNQTAERMFGYTREEAIGRLGTEWIAEPDRALVRQKMLSGCEEAYEVTALRKNGSTFPCEIQARMVEGTTDSPLRVTALRDISKRTQAEVFNQLFSQVLSNSPNEVLILDRESLEVIGSNRSARERLELEKGDCTIFDIFHSTGNKTLHEVVADFGTEVAEYTMLPGEVKRRDGTLVPVELHVQTAQSTPPVLTLVLLDISDRVKAQKEKLQIDRRLQQAQKMESLGVLAGGVAHDFNNILMTILGNADLASFNLDPISPAQKNLQEIIRASKRAADLAKQMLAYSGKGAFVIQPLNLSAIVRDMVELLEVSISKNSRLRLQLDPDLPTVLADATQVRQVIMNLITNASEAMADQPGEIDLCTGKTEITDTDLHSFAQQLPAAWSEDVRPGEFVFLGVKDSGCGMNQRTLERIFDPFFSTKFTGRGLGMSAVLGIVRGHHGMIKVDSEPNQGSRFQIFLPTEAPQKVVELEEKQDSSQTSAGDSTVQNKRILIVDDEAGVRAIAVEILEHLGHQAVPVESGSAALDLLQSGDDRFDLVLLDLTMPGLDGRQTFERLRQEYPKLKIVLCSGYSKQEATRKFASGELDGFLQKPYGVRKIRSALEDLLA